MEQDGLAGIGGVELPGRVGHEDHRELQALGAMDGHDGDAAGPCPAGGGLLPGGTGQRGRVDGPDEGRSHAAPDHPSRQLHLPSPPQTPSWLPWLLLLWELAGCV